MTLEESRKQIDLIDKEMLSLFEKRMAVADNIAKIKIEKNLPILNADREKEILESAEKSVNIKYSPYAREFCAFVMELSRRRQREVQTKICGKENSFKKELLSGKKELINPRVTVQGVEGSYASIAAKRMYNNCTLSYVSSWEEVMKAISEGKTDYGVLPVENSTAGSVIDVYDLLLKYKYSIVKALKLPVRHCLLGVKGAKKEDIKEVYSHPHAFPQCRPFFKENCEIKKITCPNTAVAAKSVAEFGDIKKAAIASKECAEIYGLDVIAEAVQQTDDNCTRFVSISKNSETHEHADKVSLILSLPHKTGSLYRLLSSFSLCGLNLTKIESRPDPKTPFEYYFYVDFLGSVLSLKTVNMLLQFKEELPFVYYLGNYSET